MTESALRIAFVGTGRMAGVHLDTLRRVAIPARVGAAFDNTASRAREFAAHSGARAYNSIREMLSDYRPHVVHVVTPRGRHFEPTLEALHSGASVYVEKPFVETEGEARSVLDAASRKGGLVCAGHQLIYDPVFRSLMQQATRIGPIVQVDSHFAFRPEPRLSRAASANILADILPHPLYSLIAAMEYGGAKTDEIEIEALRAAPQELHVILRAQSMTGRLSVTLRGRPVASTLTMMGEGGLLTADFIRGTVIGAGNAGLEPLEKIFNPLVEGWQLIARTAPAVARRVVKGIAYPGLAELITAFYRSVSRHEPSPITPAHLLRVTAVYQHIVDRLGESQPARVSTPERHENASTPIAVVTGARGFLGRHIARHLVERGYRVRGISRAPDPHHPHVQEWVRADLSEACPREALAGADVVVHAAAETCGGFEEHSRNSIGVARVIARAMHDAKLQRLVYVSSMAVLEPARRWRHLDDQSPLARAPRRLGPYAWGKTMAEQQLLSDAATWDLDVRIIRPGMLIDPKTAELPGLVGRRLFGRWHLGLGRPGLRVAALDVDRCGAAIAWCATHFAEAPRVVNLFDPEISSRKQLLEIFRATGWNGRMVWVPIGVLAAGLTLARSALSLAKGKVAEPFDAFAVMRPQCYDPSSSRALLDAAHNGNANVPGSREFATI